GVTDPQTSTAGMLALMAISDTNDDGEIDETERQGLFGLKQLATVMDSTLQIFDGIRTAAQKSDTAALKYVSAFPALERDVLTYNTGHPKIPLVALYPTDGIAEADNPYLVLNAKWSTTPRQKVANAFLQFLRTPQEKAEFQSDGYRDSNRLPGKDLNPNNG